MIEKLKLLTTDNVHIDFCDKINELVKATNATHKYIQSMQELSVQEDQDQASRIKDLMKELKERKDTKMEVEKDKAGNPIKPLTELCFDGRKEIESTKEAVRELFSHPELAMKDGDAIANLKLAYRHLEDARMRLGKVVQVLDGGESCYPR